MLRSAAGLASSEYEAQFRAALANVHHGRDGLAAAVWESAVSQSDLDFAKSDYERGQEPHKAQVHHQADFRVHFDPYEDHGTLIATQGEAGELL